MSGSEAVANRLERRVSRRVCVTEWRWSAGIGGYVAPGGWELRKRGGVWIARQDGDEVLRDQFLCNVIMELCG